MSDKTKILPLRIFAMNDFVEWWIGSATPEQMRDAYRAELGEDTMDDDHLPEPLTEKQLDSLLYYYGSDKENPTRDKSRTFREQLAIETEAGVLEPRMFASEEW